MHYVSVATLLAVGPALCLGASSALDQTSPAAVGSAQLFWAGDTSIVSQFLSTATSLSGQDLANAAASALASEGDELVQKGVIDEALDTSERGMLFGSTDILVVANATLVGNGTFQSVLDGLNDLVTNGADYSPDEVLSSITTINRVRCNSVLPAIDTYLEVASLFSGMLFPNQAVRPDNCP